jgi:hypothetical protein
VIYIRTLAVPWLGLMALLTSCATVKETHYFQQPLPDSSGRANYFRLQVRGEGTWSSARYIAGFYDERAIDLFFNEVKAASSTAPASDTKDTAPAASPSGAIRPLFPEGTKLPGTDESVKPLKDPGNGTFLMIFSTNANAVADAIGQFAENQLAADALTNIVNRRDVEAFADRQDRAERRMAGADALTAELDALVSLLPDGAAPPADQTERSMLRLLNAIGRELGHTGTFASVDQASGWFMTPQR